MNKKKHKKVPWTREIRNAYARRYYAKHQEQAIAATRKWQQKNMELVRHYSRKLSARRKKYLDALKKNGQCTFCSEKDFRVLEWAHKNRKTKTIAVPLAGSWKALRKELTKCLLLCANCHRRKDYKDRLKQARLNRIPLLK